MNSKSIKKNTVYNTIKTLSSIVFPLITFPYVSRTLLVENVGKINFGLSFVSYFSLIASLGINVYAIRECSKVSNNRKELSKTASQIFSLNLLTTIFAYILLLLFLIFYKKIANYRTLIVIQSLSILFSTLGTDWLNTAMEDFKYITIRTIVFQFVSLFLLFILIHSPQDYMKYAAISVISSSGYNLVNMFYRKKYCDISITKNIEIKKHYLPIIYLFVMLLSQTIFNNVDMSMLGIMKGDFEVGIYSTAHKIMNIISQIVASILWVVLPRISFYYKNNNFGEINNLLRKILGFNITLGLPCVIGTILMSNDIILLIAGKEFIQSGLVLKILMLSFFISLFGGSFLGNMILLPMNEERYYMIVCIINAIINIILNYIYIPYFASAAAAGTTVICSILVFILLVIHIDKRINIDNVKLLFLQPIIGSVSIIIICYACKQINSLYIRIFISIVLSVITYFVIQLMFKNDLCLALYNAVVKKFRKYLIDNR